MIRSLGGILAALSLAACASHDPNVNRNLAAIPAAQGIAVFSTGASKPSSWAPIKMVLRRPNQPLAPTDGEHTGIVLDNSFEKSDFADEHGHARMLVLDEGDYCLAPASLNPYLVAHGGTVAFHVRKGEITYIGNVFLDGDALRLRDRPERDVAAFRKGNAALAAQPVVTALAQVKKSCDKP